MIDKVLVYNNNVKIKEWVVGDDKFEVDKFEN